MYNMLEFPSGDGYTPNMLAKAKLARWSVLVTNDLSFDSAIPEFVKYAELHKALEIPRLIVLINKSDSEGFDFDSLKGIYAPTLDRLGYNVDKVTFLPISGLSGSGINDFLEALGDMASVGARHSLRNGTGDNVGNNVSEAYREMWARLITIDESLNKDRNDVANWSLRACYMYQARLILGREKFTVEETKRKLDAAVEATKKLKCDSLLSLIILSDQHHEAEDYEHAAAYYNMAQKLLKDDPSQLKKLPEGFWSQIQFQSYSKERELLEENKRQSQRAKNERKYNKKKEKAEREESEKVAQEERGKGAEEETEKAAEVEREERIEREKKEVLPKKAVENTDEPLPKRDERDKAGKDEREKPAEAEREKAAEVEKERREREKKEVLPKKAVENTDESLPKTYSIIPFDVCIDKVAGRNCLIGYTKTNVTTKKKSFVEAQGLHISNFEKLVDLCDEHPSLLKVEEVVRLGNVEYLITEVVYSVEEYFKKLDGYSPRSSNQTWWNSIKTTYLSIFRDIVRALMHLFVTGAACGDLSFNIFVTANGKGRLLPSMDPTKKKTDDLKQLLDVMRTVILLPGGEDKDLSFIPEDLRHFFDLVKSVPQLFSADFHVDELFVLDHPYFWSSGEKVDFAFKLRNYVKTAMNSDKVDDRMDKLKMFEEWEDNIEHVEPFWSVYTEALIRKRIGYKRNVDIVRFMCAVYTHVNEWQYKKVRPNQKRLDDRKIEEGLISCFPQFYTQIITCLCACVNLGKSDMMRVDAKFLIELSSVYSREEDRPKVHR